MGDSSPKSSRFPVKPVLISALGIVSWDELVRIDAYPPEGSFSMISERQSAPGGTTGNLAMACRKLGADVRFFSKVCADDAGDEILRTYQADGIEMVDTHVVPGTTDVSFVLVSDQTAERTILWHMGPCLERGDRIDIERLFAADVVVIDSVDYELRTFLTDLPAHTLPKTRILGPLNYVANVVANDKVAIALRHDVIVGNENEYRLLFDCDDADVAFGIARSQMVGTNCRLAIMTRGQNGSSAVDETSRWDCPAVRVDPIDTTGAGDAFAGAIAFGLAQRWAVADLLAFASAVSSRVVGRLGAQAGLPTFDETLAFLENST